MIRINQLALEVGHGPGAIKKKAARLLKVPETSIRRVDVVRRSIDARKKDRILYSYIVDVKLAEKKKEETAVKKADSRNIQIETEARYRYPAHGKEVLKDRPVIIGAGPAGLFAALALAENGFAPLLLEQGDPVEVRAEKVEAFWRNGDDSLDLHSNVQFGEGGAGTFSDGKLNTLVKDVSGRNGKVLETFVEAGADGSILYDSRPHIGTDVLREAGPDGRWKDLRRPSGRRGKDPKPDGGAGCGPQRQGAIFLPVGAEGPYGAQGLCRGPKGPASPENDQSLPIRQGGCGRAGSRSL